MTRIHVGDAREVLSGMAVGSVHMCMTSPPYWGLRSYEGGDGMIGLEPTLDEHIANLVDVFRHVRRVLRDDGTLWLNYGDAYASNQASGGASPDGDRAGRADTGAVHAVVRRADQSGLKPKDLMLLPARVALALQADGWWVRSEIVWHKPNPMPESVMDRPTSAHEKVFLLSKSARYFYDADACRQPFTGNTHTRRKDGVTNPRKGSDPNDRRAGSFRSDDPKWAGQYAKPYEPGVGKMFDGTGAQDARSVKSRIVDGVRSGRIAGANLRNVWSIPTHSFPGSHFATFPPALVERCVLAGTSARGVCADCGAPWVRVMEGSTGLQPDDEYEGRAPGTRRRSPKGGQAEWNARTERKTTGWRPTCECGADTRPAVVLDCFGGAGTVGLVAERLQRDAILIEISDKYANMATERIRADAPLLAQVEVVE